MAEYSSLIIAGAGNIDMELKGSNISIFERAIGKSLIGGHRWQTEL